MAVSKNNEPKILAIPVGSIREEREYILLDFERNDKAKHELNCFVREVCSKNALRVSDIFKVIQASKDSFSPELLKVINAFTKKQLEGCVQSFIYKEIGGGYGTSIEYLEKWRMYQVDHHKLKKEYGSVRTFFSKIFPSIPFLVDYFYYYDGEFVNPYTTPDDELPLYMNHEWPSEIDEQLYKARIRKINENNKGYKKPNMNVLQEA